MPDAEFWLTRWRDGAIGFHQGHTHRALERFIDRLDLDAHPGAVFLPLCGKAHDMAWLAGRGHPVIGVDVSEVAARSFFEEHGLSPRVTADGPGLKRYTAGSVTFFVGDVFALDPTHLADVSAVFDRGALVALDDAERARYVDHLARVLPGACNTLLVVVEYDETVMSGPPFSVREEEVNALFEARCEIDLLMRHDVLEEEPKFRERGLQAMAETAYLLRS
ncbi:MAG: thiopurine S-methyltransferase [Pseudomonadota bacterium]